MSATLRSTRQMQAFIEAFWVALSVAFWAWEARGIGLECASGSRDLAARGTRHLVPPRRGARQSLPETITLRTNTTPVIPRPPARTTWLAVLAAGLVPLAVFASALHPGLPAGDSGEL